MDKLDLRIEPVEWRSGQDVEKRHFCCRILADILQRGRSER